MGAAGLKDWPGKEKKWGCGLEEKKGEMAVVWLVFVAGGCRKKFKPYGGAPLSRDRFRVFVFFFSCQNCPHLNVLKKPVFIGRMLLGFSTWSLNFFLFCKF